ncbi:hypothetical protein N486_10640 [Clostridium botulinum B2 128]|uniref:HD domain-containing protein n=1 Tax=Clostridium botulinum TaxID=1491 RepID=UPI0007E172F7|nr:hypothetical protein [Clostridium botulinum]KEI76191.1 hypothetical protein N486_10640 [Clostridium botulinum B2 128]NEZ74035.1 hypothetical protein [Clostridium botulinum]NEZ98013.1 hypothetical protein [Clostridium botulinum]NFA30751.1 hypothetical protein [Clostridium botulinum]NFA83836.1 hypothetical protein [Clostridium botulinum]
MRNVPDFNIELSQACDYILSTDIARKAIDNPPFTSFTNILRDLIEAIDKLADNCHMPEFTNHALPHICSVVKRASEWGKSDKWLDVITSAEAGYLLMALVIHDMGMLSQDPGDLPNDEISNSRKGISNISDWTRRTHVSRLKKLLFKILKGYGYDINQLEEHLKFISEMAASHSFWPWNDKFKCDKNLINSLKLDSSTIESLNAIIAVCDLLDEDANRCDTVTLIKHRHGSVNNIAHWLRHALTIEVIGVKEHKIIVRFRNLPDVPLDFEYVFRALRNHYKLTLFYNDKLRHVGADIKNIEFQPSSGMPNLIDEVSEELKIWKENIEFKYCITEQILNTFMNEACNIASDNIIRINLDKIGAEVLDLSKFHTFLYPCEPLTLEEKIINKILKTE